MEREAIHELAAAYALDALDPEEEREFEEHLRRCPRCREELASLQASAASLAYGAEAPPPPPALRDRILAEVRSEHATVVPLRRRMALPALGAAAAAAAGVAIGLGVWGASVSGSLDQERSARAAQEKVLAVLAQPEANRIPLSGANGTLVVAHSGEAALVVTGLAAAPEDTVYEVWVIEDGAPAPAGIFAGGGASTVVALSRPVPAGATVAITLEPEGRVDDQPTGEPLASAQNA